MRSRLMPDRPLKRQRGMSIWLAIILVLLLVVVGGTALKATPSVLENLAINSALDEASKGDSPSKIRDLFQRQADVNDITSLDKKDLAITKDGDGFLVGYEYEKQIPLAGPVSLLILYKRGEGKEAD